LYSYFKELSWPVAIYSDYIYSVNTTGRFSMPRVLALHKGLGHGAALFLLHLLLGGCAPPPLGDSEAALALEDIAAGDGASRLKAQTPQPSRRTVSFEIEQRRYAADLYLSPAGARAGIVLVPGVVPAGKDDPRLVALAHTLARLRFAVLVPDMLGLRNYKVRASDVREVADAFRYLSADPELAPSGRAGIAGFSYGAGPVVIAAVQPDIRDQVRFVVAVGGYYDLHDVVTYFTTGFYRVSDAPGDGWRFLWPHSYVKWVFALSNTELLEHPRDRRALRAVAAAIIRGTEGTELEFMPSLAPDARALYALLTNDDPARVPTLIDGLPPRIRHELEGINPAAHDLSALTAQVILLHGRSDTLIPYSESVALACALPPRKGRLFLIDGLAHVDIKPRAADLPQLLQAMEALLAQREE